jgi:putative spermidine/putrescine transport system ATP-binding protein/putrescine transport system ATP-binding protein
VAVDGVNFSVAQGETVALLGPSGCGKTTILRLIAGFEIPDEGTIIIENEDMRQRRPYERKVGLLFQDYALFPHMSVEENLGYGLKRQLMDRETTATRVREIESLVRLDGLMKRRPHQLSGGQQQRVALGRALATRPAIMLLDEPLSALDAKLREQLRLELRDILISVGATTILVTHDQEEALSLAGTVLLMRAGRIVQTGSPAEIYNSPNSRYVAEFVGRANWFDGGVQGMMSSSIAKFETADGLELLARASLGASGERLGLYIRPERVIVGLGSSPPSDSEKTVLLGHVVDVTHLGPNLHLWIQLKTGRRVLAIEKDVGRATIRKGERAHVVLHASDCVILPDN